MSVWARSQLSKPGEAWSRVWARLGQDETTRARIARFVQNRRVMLGLGVILFLSLAALLAPVVSPHDPDDQILINRLAAPSLDHPFGTDSLGRDILSRAIYGARVSLSVSLVAMLISVSIGALVGLIAGFSRGIIDNVLMRITDVVLAFPVFILLITVVAIYGSGLFSLMLILGLTAWPQTARLIRAEVLSMADREFVVAAQVTGASNWRVMLVHMLPNVVPILIVAATLRVAILVLVEAGLSFFGLGVPPPTASWGNMVADGKLYLETAWWITTFPGVLVIITVLAFNLLGDGLRDAFDPRRRVPNQ